LTYDEILGPNYLLEIDDEDCLWQGGVDDEITMFRSVDELLECERDAIQPHLLEYNKE